MATNRLYWATGLTGGIDGYLDAISVTDATGYSEGVPLVEGDACIVIPNGDFYVLQDSAGAVEDGVNIVIPDDNTGDLWWKRMQLGVPKDICVPYLGTETPAGWTNMDQSTGAHTPGEMIRKM